VGQVIRLIYVTVNITTATKSSLVYVAMGNNSCLLAPVLVPTGQEFDPSADKLFCLNFYMPGTGFTNDTYFTLENR
jgi:hypothetical protein